MEPSDVEWVYSLFKIHFNNFNKRVFSIYAFGYQIICDLGFNSMGS